MRNSQIMELSFKFSLKAIDLYKDLTEKREYIISKQLLRCSTSIGANVFEASAAASRKDFVHKMTIASKEARETYYWLKLLEKSRLVTCEIEVHIKDLKDIMNILTAIVKTTKFNLNK